MPKSKGECENSKHYCFLLLFFVYNHNYNLFLVFVSYFLTPVLHFASEGPFPLSLQFPLYLLRLCSNFLQAAFKIAPLIPSSLERYLISPSCAFSLSPFASLSCSLSHSFSFSQFPLLVLTLSFSLFPLLIFPSCALCLFLSLAQQTFPFLQQSFKNIPPSVCSRSGLLHNIIGKRLLKIGIPMVSKPIYGLEMPGPKYIVVGLKS